MGFDSNLIERNKWSAESPFQARFLSKEIILRCKINTEPQQTSGNPFTTSFNSEHIIMAGYHKIKNAGLQSTETSMLDLGFVLKEKQLHDFSFGTFLKGWWQKDIKGAYHWVLLPSAILKLGKTLKDPRSITLFIVTGKQIGRAHV